jgi:glycosyltransferase involved in cell wall biosynthesis
MKLLFCCESYYPSRGGVQEVMRQIAERMVAAGHEVSVATRKLPDRISNVHNGVRIQEFDVSGSRVDGLRGEVARYQEFIRSFDGEAILIKAAQQWSFDALWPILDDVKVRKVFVPCGFSGLYRPEYADYFAQLPDVLRKFDHLIFYAEKYRDIDFARAHGITTFSVIPNGASETDFDRSCGDNLRARLGIAADDFLFLTVGTPVVDKGQKEVGEAFVEMDSSGRNATLILNGAWPEIYLDPNPPSELGLSQKPRHRVRVLIDMMRLIAPRFLRLTSIKKGLILLYRKGWRVCWERLFPKPPTLPAEPLHSSHDGLDITTPLSPAGLEASDTSGADKSFEQNSGRKRILRLNLPREDVVSAFLDADLFVFASRVEYSPLVLFEAAAAGTPFLTVPVGNSGEIVRWTGGGWVCPAEVDDVGYTRVSSSVLAREMEKAVRSPELLRQLGKAGKQAWLDRFTWAKIAKSYERVLSGETVMAQMESDAAAGS